MNLQISVKISLEKKTLFIQIVGDLDAEGRAEGEPHRSGVGGEGGGGGRSGE